MTSTLSFKYLPVLWGPSKQLLRGATNSPWVPISILLVDTHTPAVLVRLSRLRESMSSHCRKRTHWFFFGQHFQTQKRGKHLLLFRRNIFLWVSSPTSKLTMCGRAYQSLPTARGLKEWGKGRRVINTKLNIVSSCEQTVVLWSRYDLAQFPMNQKQLELQRNFNLKN